MCHNCSRPVLRDGRPTMYESESLKVEIEKRRADLEDREWEFEVLCARKAGLRRRQNPVDNTRR
jgi:hypothetical protein